MLHRGREGAHQAALLLGGVLQLLLLRGELLDVRLDDLALLGILAEAVGGLLVPSLLGDGVEECRSLLLGRSV